MSAADDVKSAFEGTRGKILIFGGALAVLGYVAYTRWTGTPDTSAVIDPEQTAVESDATRVPQTDPVVGNDTQTSTTNTRPTTNPEWLSKGVDLLVGRGTGAADASSALNKALDGEGLTSQQYAWVSQVIGVLGTPPDGMPPLNATPPTTASVKPARPTGVVVQRVDNNSVTIGWNPVGDANGYEANINNGQMQRTGTTHQTWAFLKANTRYSGKVRAMPKTGSTPSDWTSFSFTTKK